MLQGRDFSNLSLRCGPGPACCAPEDPGAGLMTGDGGGDTRNTISGGTQYGPVLQGRDFINSTFVTQPGGCGAGGAGAVARAGGGVHRPRRRSWRQLAGLLDPAGDGGAVVVSAVAGLAGVGKTALAIQAGHAAREAGWFPGGVLFIDLHGYDEAPVQPGQALDSLLRALGVPGEYIPPGAEDRAGLYRSVLAQVTDAGAGDRGQRLVGGAGAAAAAGSGAAPGDASPPGIPWPGWGRGCWMSRFWMSRRRSRCWMRSLRAAARR